MNILDDNFEHGDPGKVGRLPEDIEKAKEKLDKLTYAGHLARVERINAQALELENTIKEARIKVCKAFDEFRDALNKLENGST